MRRRQQCLPRPGRPRLEINEDHGIDLLLDGYSRRDVDSASALTSGLPVTGQS